VEIFLYEMLIVVDKTEEHLDVVNGLRGQSFSNEFNVRQVHEYTFNKDNVSEEDDFLDVEFAFLKFYI
jgi:hypothetical protein